MNLKLGAILSFFALLTGCASTNPTRPKTSGPAAEIVDIDVIVKELPGLLQKEEKHQR
jgi:hypothetical protein